MPVRRAARRVAAAILATSAVAALATACGNSPERLRDICDDVVAATAALPPYRADDPRTALPYAIGRFAAVEKAVGTVRESGVPTSLRDGWIEPALASMTDWSPTLERLRAAVAAGDPTAVRAAMRDATALGTEGVDPGVLTAAGLGSCAAAFTAPDVPEA